MIGDSLMGQNDAALTAILFASLHLQQTITLQRSKRMTERGAVHHQQLRQLP